MPNAHRVSVVLPTYNRAHVLPRAMESVLSQDYRDLELIVVDDGSNDETEKLVTSWGDPRIRYLRFGANRGVSVARNAGLEVARGDFIAFIDSDDRWLPGKLSLQVGILSRYPDVGVVFADYANHNLAAGTSGLGFEQTRAGIERLLLAPLEPDLFLIQDGLARGLLLANFIATSSVVARATALGGTGGFDPALLGPEDLDLWLRAALLGVRFAMLKRVLVERFKDSTSLSFRAAEQAPYVSLVLEKLRRSAAAAGQRDLIPLARRMEHCVWRSAILEHAKAGARASAIKCFLRCARSGITLRAFAYLGAALLGPRAIGLARRVNRR